VAENGSALVIIDYQNIHLTGHGCFAATGAPAHESLVHPLHFANQVLLARHSRLAELAVQRNSQPPAPVDLVKVLAFRGQPSNKENPDGYRRNLTQRAEWERDQRVEVTYRPLKYHRDEAGKVLRVEEKGVDVMIALALVRCADSGDYDVVILASHDTDLEPALDAALETRRVKIETAGWRARKRLKSTNQRLWHTFLQQEHFERARDLKDYT
jgi:hypothetical protein